MLSNTLWLALRSKVLYLLVLALAISSYINYKQAQTNGILRTELSSIQRTVKTTRQLTKTAKSLTEQQAREKLQRNLAAYERKQEILNYEPEIDCTDNLPDIYFNGLQNTGK